MEAGKPTHLLQSNPCGKPGSDDACVFHDLMLISHHTPPYLLFLGLDILARTLILPHFFESKEE